MADEKKTLSDEQLNDVTGGSNRIPPLIMCVDTTAASSKTEAASLVAEETDGRIPTNLASEVSANTLA